MEDCIGMYRAVPAMLAGALALLLLSACQVTPTPGTSAIAENAASEDDCADVIVSARIIKQTPSVAPECDCIIMRWPWFLQLDVDRVVHGRAGTGQHTVLALLHTGFADTSRRGKWRLRRNSLGGFNLMGMEDDTQDICPAGTPPAEPFINPGPEKTLEDLEREGAEHYGRYY